MSKNNLPRKFKKILNHLLDFEIAVCYLRKALGGENLSRKVLSRQIFKNYLKKFAKTVDKIFHVMIL